MGNVFQCQVLFLAQGMTHWQHQHVLPFITGQGDQLRIARQGFGGNTNFSNLVHQHFGHLLRRALMQADIDFGVGLAQLGHWLWQHIAGLRVGGGY